MIQKESLRIKYFGPIKDVNLEEVMPFAFFIGESGSGKSTILKALALMRHMYKQLNLRSYLKLGNVIDKTIVKESNRSIVDLLGRNDSLASFKHDTNVGGITNRCIHLIIEEPELSLFPKAQRSSINMLVRKCINANTRMTLAIATHSPYIINHLSLLLKAHDKKVLIEDTTSRTIQLKSSVHIISLPIRNSTTNAILTYPTSPAKHFAFFRKLKKLNTNRTKHRPH